MKLNIKRSIDAKISYREIVKEILSGRDIDNPDIFLSPPKATEISLSVFFSKDEFKELFKKTVDLLTEIKKKKQTIVVYTDYDADGITAGAVLWETLYLLGFSVMPYVPDRKKEGYGFSKSGIDAVKEKYNPALIISCDHGIAAHEKIAYAASQDIPIIVTDHHQKLNSNPDAFAVFHTDKLSGSGVAYFFAKELYEHFISKGAGFNTNAGTLGKYFKTDYTAIAAIGTVADLVPLIGASRSLVAQGLAALSTTSRAGIRSLLDVSGNIGKTVTTYEVGYMLAPRINAFGRLGDATDALRLLCTNNEQKAAQLAKKAQETNTKRQKLLETAVEEATRMVSGKEKLIVVFSPNWEEGIVGLIAAKLVEKFYRPAIVLTVGNGFAKGSARSIPGFDITYFLRQHKAFLLEAGGHKAAAGLKLTTAQVSEFIEYAQKSAETLLTDADLVPQLTVDIAMPISVATLELALELEILQPFGIGNPKPVFYSTAQVIEVKKMGKNNDHLKLAVKDNKGFPIEILFFSKAKEHSDITAGQNVEIAYCLDVNRWNGTEKVQGIGKYLLKK